MGAKLFFKKKKQNSLSFHLEWSAEESYFG